MTEEQAPGPEISADLLHIAPSSKKADRDYQWFAVILAGRENEDACLRAMGGGWEPVPRNAMPAESTSSAELIERKGMRLYERSAAVSEQIRSDQVQRALRDVEAVLRRSHRQNDPYPPARREEILAAAGPYADKWQRFHHLRSRIESHPRGSLLVLHEETIHPRVRPILARFWQALLQVRVVYLPRDESEIADRQGTSYAEWGWCKKDLVRERLIPTRLPQHRFVVRTFTLNIPKLPPIPWRKVWGKIRRR